MMSKNKQQPPKNIFAAFKEEVLEPKGIGEHIASTFASLGMSNLGLSSMGVAGGGAMLGLATSVLLSSPSLLAAGFVYGAGKTVSASLQVLGRCFGENTFLEKAGAHLSEVCDFLPRAALKTLGSLAKGVGIKNSLAEMELYSSDRAMAGEGLLNSTIGLPVNFLAGGYIKDQQDAFHKRKGTSQPVVPAQTNVSEAAAEVSSRDNERDLPDPLSEALGGEIPNLEM